MAFPPPPNELALGRTEQSLADLFPLDRSYCFLNHGSFGSVPHEVLATQQAIRMEIEARPIEMLDRRLRANLSAARARVAQFVGTEPERLGFVVNATEGVNAFLRSLRWERGDEVIVVDQVYNAMRQSLLRLTREFGIGLRIVEVGLPVPTPSAWIDAVESAFTPRTRMLLIDHITSPTALVLPVVELVRRARARGVRTLVDGAHAPGSIALSIDAIGADAYTANLHKWVCAPKGCAFLAVSSEHATEVHPLATSHFFGEGYTREFDWQGTRDVSSWLAAPAAIDFFERFGWERVRARNHSLACWAQRFLCARWSVEPISPLDGSMLASMAAVWLPPRVQAMFGSAVELQAHLYAAHRIEIPVIDWKGRWHVRVSCHLHTNPALIEQLAEAILGLGTRQCPAPAAVDCRATAGAPTKSA